MAYKDEKIKTLIEQIRNGDVSINEAYNRIKPPKKPVSPKTKDVVVEFPVARETVVEQALPFEETADDVIEDDPVLSIVERREAVCEPRDAVCLA